MCIADTCTHTASFHGSQLRLFIHRPRTKCHDNRITLSDAAGRRLFQSPFSRLLSSTWIAHFWGFRRHCEPTFISRLKLNSQRVRSGSSDWRNDSFLPLAVIPFLYFFSFFLPPPMVVPTPTFLCTLGFFLLGLIWRFPFQEATLERKFVMQFILSHDNGISASVLYVSTEYVNRKRITNHVMSFTLQDVEFTIQFCWIFIHQGSFYYN